MKQYLAGLQSYQLDMGSECTAFTDPRLESTVQGIKREHSGPERRASTPLTCPYLLRLLSLMPLTNYNNPMHQAAFTLAIAGFLRVGEFTY